MRGTGAEQLVVAMKCLKGPGAKGLRHSVGVTGQPVWGGTREFDKAF
jgi:hypothetical protein